MPTSKRSRPAPNRSKSMATILRDRLRKSRVPFHANDTLAGHISDFERQVLQQEVEARVEALLRTLVIDIDNDPNTRDTAARVAKMFICETFRGRYEQAPKIVTFPNTKKLDELYTLGPVSVRSTCAHHLCPVVGRAWCGVIPGDHLIGISKFARLTDWVASRPQIQEEAVVQLADILEATMKPKGLGVVITASHSCMTFRGVKEAHTAMSTSVMRGIIHESPAARAEFLQFVHNGH